MTLTLNLTPELEHELRAAADSAGVDVESFVLQAVKARLGDRPTPIKGAQTSAEWQAKFDAWLASHRPVEHVVDDSRESIYEDRI